MAQTKPAAVASMLDSRGLQMSWTEAAAVTSMSDLTALQSNMEKYIN